MREQDISGHKVKIYDSIDEMPITRFHKYNKYLLIDSGIGSDLEDLDGHFNKAIKYLRIKPELAITELENLRQLMHFINENISPKYLAYAALVVEIDDKPITDISDEGLKKVLEILGNAKKGWFDRFFESVKKKIDTELSLYFPANFDDATVKEFYDKVKARTQLVLTKIISGKNTDNQVEEIDNFLLTLAKPKTFSGRDNAEILFDKQFEEMSLLLSHQLSVDPPKMTVLQYYNAFEYLKKLSKQRKPQI